MKYKSTAVRYDYKMLEIFAKDYERKMLSSGDENSYWHDQFNDVKQEMEYRQSFLKKISKGNCFAVTEQNIAGSSVYYFTVLDVWKHRITGEICCKCRKEWCSTDFNNNPIAMVEDQYLTASQLLDKHYFTA